MNILLNLILFAQLASAAVMIGLILIQHGKGADMGAAFGSGGSGSLFGASGSANFLSRSTAVLAAVFFISTLAQAYFANARPAGVGSVLDRAAVTAPAAAPSVNAEQPAGASVPPASTPAPATGAGQIPTK